MQSIAELVNYYRLNRTSKDYGIFSKDEVIGVTPHDNFILDEIAYERQSE
jgi:hypothetical protein